MKALLFYLLGAVFPFAVFLILDLPGPALVALVMQSTGILWPIAIFWSFKHIGTHLEAQRLKQQQKIAAAAAQAAAKEFKEQH